MTEKLLPCPFCGGDAHMEQTGNRRQSCIIECESCGCRLETGEEGALCGSRWNERFAQPAASAKFWQSHDRWLAPRFEPDGDYVSVPRGLLGAACSAIDEKRYEPILLAELRRYTTGDLSAPVAAQPENIRAGDPYDDPAFEGLCREHQTWGTAASALCAVFWRAGKVGALTPPADGLAQPSIAAAIHYPECWDDVAYPTLESALIEVYAHFRCTNQDTHAAQQGGRS